MELISNYTERVPIVGYKRTTVIIRVQIKPPLVPPLHWLDLFKGEGGEMIV